MSEERTSNRRVTSANTPKNAIDFLVEQAIKGKVNTCIPVRVDSCTAPGTGDAAGYVSCTPLVVQRGADGKALQSVELPKLPFFRLYCGDACIVCDPQPGDQGLAVFAQSDSSQVKAGENEPVQPGSFRFFDMADGFYVGGFLGVPPVTWIELDPEEDKINIHAPNGIHLTTDKSCTVDAGEDIVATAGKSITATAGENVSIEAASEIKLSAPTIIIEGSLITRGKGGQPTTSTVEGTLEATEQVIGGGVHMTTHIHEGVVKGGDTSEAPVGGS